MTMTRRDALALAVAPLALTDCLTGQADAATGRDDPRWAHDPRLAKLWRCTNPDCPGHLYDPLLGEEVFEIPPGTAFEDLPEDYTCPECGKGTQVFVVSTDRSKP